MVYSTGGRRVYLPFETKPIVDGVRINSPHCLCKLLVKKPGISRYTVAIAQVNGKLISQTKHSVLVRKNEHDILLIEYLFQHRIQGKQFK